MAGKLLNFLTVENSSIRLALFVVFFRGVQTTVLYTGFSAGQHDALGHCAVSAKLSLAEEVKNDFSCVY